MTGLAALLNWIKARMVIETGLLHLLFGAKLEQLGPRCCLDNTGSRNPNLQ